MGIKVAILELEHKYTELQNDLNKLSSDRKKILLIYEFFQIVLASNNLKLIEVYTVELFPRYLALIKLIKIRGLNPNILSSLTEQFKKLIEFEFLQAYSKDFEEALVTLIEKHTLLITWLNNDDQNNRDQLIYFPALEKTDSNSLIGFLEIIRVQINNGENQFIVIPSESGEDEQLQKQIHLSWAIAIKYCSNFITHIKSSHSVELKFENRLCVYIGNSLGIALTLSFIEAILKHYNSSTIIKINGTIAVTGGIDTNSNIISTSKVIIEAKVDTVFFSDAHIFCVPKVDEFWALEKLFELKKEFPKRDLRIVGLTDLEDLLNRRNIVDMHKKAYVERLFSYTIKKWKSIFLAAILTIIFSSLFTIDFDDAPSMFEQKGNLLNIQNKKGKVLWSIRLNYASSISKVDRSKFSKKLVDINEDGINEVLIAEEEIVPESHNFGRVACFDKDKKLIWEYLFRDSVSTFRKWTTTYNISILDTLTLSNKKVLLLMARNIPNFANAIFTIDLKTGLRIDSTNTIWNAGAINNCLVGDFNEDGKKELIIAGSHNGYERALLFSVNLDKLKGQTPAPDRYIFNGIPKADLNEFILLPHTDYGKYFWRSNAVPSQHLVFVKHVKEFELATLEGSDKPILFYYRFDKNLNFLWVDCADNAQQLRDTLVVKGILNSPFTNTNEYFEILRKQILYRVGGKFLSIDEKKR